MKKIIKYIFYLIIIYLIVALFPIFTFRKLNNNNPLPVACYKGAYHIHSNFSDGASGIDVIQRAAKDAGLDFIIVTDHGNPNKNCVESTAWIDNTLVVGDSEITLRGGHMGAGCDNWQSDKVFTYESQKTIDDLNAIGGFSFIAHPYDKNNPWTDWEVRKTSGIEIYNFKECMQKMSGLKMITFPVQYFFNSSYSFLKFLKYPKESLGKWYFLAQKQKTSMIFALDNHGPLNRLKAWYPAIPSYQAVFDMFDIYVLGKKELVADAKESATIIRESIKSGRFFNVIEAIAPANGFNFYFKGVNGQKIKMGEFISDINGELIVETPFNFTNNIEVWEDNKLFKSIENNREYTNSFPVKSKGIYRVVVKAKESMFPKLPWICSNPIYIGVDYTNDLPVSKDFEVTSLSDEDLDFKIEKNKKSKAYLIKEENNFKLDYTLIEENNNDVGFWVALALRNQNIDVSSYKGIVIDVNADKPLRLWVEIRGSEKEEFHLRSSFLVDDKGKKFLSFDNFVHAGLKKKGFLGKKIKSIFIVSDATLNRSGFKSSVLLKSIGFYK